MKKLINKLLIVFLSLFFLAPVVSADDDRYKNRGLKQQVKKLEQQVSKLKRKVKRLSAQKFDVDCSAGELVSDALASASKSAASVTINFTGVCVDNLHITRSNVTIKGESLADEIQSPDGISITVFVENAASSVILESFTLSGGEVLLGCDDSSNVVARNMEFRDAATGVAGVAGGSCVIINASFQNFTGAAAAAINAGSVILSGDVTVENSFGVVATRSGSITLSNLLFNDPIQNFDPNGVVIRNNLFGLVVTANGSAEIAGTTFENNTLSGVNIERGGAAFFNAGNIITNKIRNNGSDGVFVNRLSIVEFQDDTNQITNNNGFGVNCLQPSVFTPFLGSPGDVSGNGSGDISVDCNTE